MIPRTAPQLEYGLPRPITDPEYFQVFRHVKFDDKDSKMLGLPKNCYSLCIGPADLHDPKADIIAKYQESGITKYLWHNLDFYTCDLYAKVNPSVVNKYIKPLTHAYPVQMGCGIWLRRDGDDDSAKTLMRVVNPPMWCELITIYHK